MTMKSSITATKIIEYKYIQHNNHGQIWKSNWTKEVQMVNQVAQFQWWYKNDSISAAQLTVI